MSSDNSKYIENFKTIEYNMDRLMEYWIDKNKEKIKEFKHLIMLDLKDKELSDISKGDEFMENYEKKLNSLNESDAFKSLMTPEEDNQKILNTERYLGEKEGIEKNQIQVVKNLHNMKMSDEQIAKAVNLSVSEVNRIINNN